jgi:hypothetical protein
MHPFPFAPGGNDACATRIREMPENLGPVPLMVSVIVQP